MLYFIVVIACVILLCAMVAALRVPSPSVDFSLPPIADRKSLLTAVPALAADSRHADERGDGLNFRAVEKRLAAAYAVIAKRVTAGENISEYERLIYENYYKITETLNFSRKNGDFSALPHVNGLPRVYALCSAVVRFSGGAVLRETFSECVRAFNYDCPLNYVEIEALPHVLGFALCEYIAAVAARHIVSDRRREAGKRDANREKVNLDLLNSAAYVTALSENGNGKFVNSLKKLCRDNGFDVEARTSGYYAAANRYALAVSATMGTVFAMKSWLTDEFLLSLSPANKILSGVPSCGYVECTLATRRHYLYRVGKIAKRQKRAETSIAAEVYARAIAEKIDVSFYLLKPLRGQFVAFSIILLKLAIASAVTVVAWFLAPAFKAAITALTAPIALAVAELIVNVLTCAATEKRPLPHLSERYIPKSANTCITYTRLISSVAEAKDAIFMLETVAAANPGERFSYAILADLPSAAEEKIAADDEIIDYLKRECSRLNSDKFNILVRNRSFLKEKNCYQGWERKRGALCDFNGLILRGETAPFRIILGRSFAAKYVVALDSDTLLNCADDLTALMEHPYNRAVNVASMNVRTDPASSEKTQFAGLFSGATGFDSYSCACESNSELFGRGNYTGKGIYRVKEFDEAVGKSFPDGRILSHDFIEGAYAGARNCDEIALDSTPTSFSLWLRRRLRWLRGDWQLLPWLCPIISSKNGKLRKNSISAIDKWHIFMGLIFTLSEACSLALIIFAAITGGFEALLLAFLPSIVRLALCLPSLVCNSESFIKSLACEAFFVCVLPVAALFGAAAIAVTLVRLVIKRGLLEWSVFAHTRGGDGAVFFVSFAFGAGLCALNAALACSFAVYVFGAAFVLAGPLQAFLSEPVKKREIPSACRSYMSLIAAKTWNYFADSCTAEHNFLPPDNYCEDGERGFCNRTSPTNIGMALVAAYSAMKLEIIDEDKARDFVQSVLATVRRMEKRNGHLYNWYDVKTLEPLPPRYVSSVDSGNFVCALLLCKTFADSETAAEIDEIIADTDFAALYDEGRGLLRIGWNETEKRFDGYYDLAASEASATYLTAIGLNKIPRAAWQNLQRRLASYSGRTLFSWSGGAFEYLLTPTFFKYSKGTLYAVSAKNSVRAQMRYAREIGSKYYGISESQYYAFENNGDYRYRAFGVPCVALGEYYGGKVIAPYATALSLGYAGERGEAQIAAFYENDLLGKYGLYEAVDDGRVIRSFMAHHQGMTMAGICNYLTDGAISSAMRELPEVRAAELLLTQPMPNAKADRKSTAPQVKTRRSVLRTIRGSGEYPEVCMYASRDYKTVIDCNGNGFSVMGNYDITRKRRNNGFFVTIKTADSDVVATRGGFANFNRGSAEFRLNTREFAVTTIAKPLVAVAGEMRVVRVKNRLDEPLDVTVEGATEPVLDERDRDLSHREYNNMFVKTSLRSDGRAVIAVRPKIGVCAGLIASGGDETEYISARGEFYGRRKSVKFGEVLDPILAAKVGLRLAPGEERKVTFALLAAFSEDDLIKRLRVAPGEEFVCREIAAPCLAGQPDNETCMVAAKILSCVGSYRDDSVKNIVNTRYPLVTVIAESVHSVPLLENMLFRFKTIYNYYVKFNLAVIYSEEYGYFAEVFNTVEAAIERVGLRAAVPSDCVFKTVNRTMMPSEAENLLRNSLDLERGNLYADLQPIVSKAPYPPAPLSVPKLAMPLAYGGFTEGGAYFIDVSRERIPKPWSNVICNSEFGSVVTESGGGFTYFGNSRECKLTEFSGDSVLDRSSETVFLGEKGNVWTITSAPIRKNCKYFVLHSFGFTRYYCNYNGLIATLTEFVGETAVKYYSVELVNTESEKRAVDAAFVADIVLGDFGEYTAPSLEGKFVSGSIVFKNANNGETCTISSDTEASSYSFNRAAMTDGNRYVRVGNLQPLNGSAAIYSVKICVPAYGKACVTFCLSACEAQPHPELADEILETVRKKYERLSCIEIVEGDPKVVYLYKWLPYQTLCSRFYARAGFYQVSGAFGFRDQLQDCLALLYVNPELVRSHILTASARQFEKGDVQHWWHPGLAGVRTHFTDDRLFLPLVVAEYVDFTGDKAVLNERAPFLCDVPIANGQKSVYASPGFTETTETVRKHCMRAISSTELNDDGFVLMKGGDWNDGMDEVGARGKGTTVFGTMLLYYVCEKFLPLASEEDKVELRELMNVTKAAVELAWEGDRYIRAITDDGIVLGSKNSEECKIDILVQAFAAISGIAPPHKASIALDTAYRLLVDEKAGIVKLLDPPIKNTRDVGYITDYPAGVRENGGQYTHAAVWFAIALFEAGECERAAKVLELLNPIEKAETADKAKKYGNEPYVISADVYSGEHAGEGGWSWYTGAAGWLYKCITEEYLGVKITDDVLTLDPRLPHDEGNYKIRIRKGECDISVVIDNSEADGDWRFAIDGVTYNSNTLRLFSSLNGKNIVLLRQK